MNVTIEIISKVPGDNEKGGIVNLRQNLHIFLKISFSSKYYYNTNISSYKRKIDKLLHVHGVCSLGDSGWNRFLVPLE